MMQKSVFLTGASTGIGYQCILDMAARGYLVFAGLRSKVPSFDNEPNIVQVILDVTSADQIAQAVLTVREALAQHQIEGLYGLVNNAGIAVGGPLEYLALDEIRRQFEVNVFSQIAVIQAFLPLLRQYGPTAKIINMGSISGRSFLPFAAPYSASKHALKAFSDALRVELAPWGIQTSLVEPGVITTPIWQKAAEKAQQWDSTANEKIRRFYGDVLEAMAAYLHRAAERGISPEAVSQVVLSILEAERPKARYLVGRDAKLSALLMLLPMEYLTAIAKRRLYRKQV